MPDPVARLPLLNSPVPECFLLWCSCWATTRSGSSEYEIASHVVLSLGLISRWCPARVQQAATEHEDEELASTRLSLELGNAGLQSSPCSSSSSEAGQQQPLQAATSAAVPGYGPSRPRDMHAHKGETTASEYEDKNCRRLKSLSQDIFFYHTFSYIQLLKRTCYAINLNC